MLTIRRQEQVNAHILILPHPAFQAAGGIHLFDNGNVLLLAKTLYDIGKRRAGIGKRRKQRQRR